MQNITLITSLQEDSILLFHAPVSTTSGVQHVGRAQPPLPGLMLYMTTVLSTPLFCLRHCSKYTTVLPTSVLPTPVFCLQQCDALCVDLTLKSQFPSCQLHLVCGASSIFLKTNRHLMANLSYLPSPYLNSSHGSFLATPGLSLLVRPVCFHLGETTKILNTRAVDKVPGQIFKQKLDLSTSWFYLLKSSSLYLYTLIPVLLPLKEAL